MEEVLVIGVLVLIGYLIYKIHKLKEDYIVTAMRER